MKLLNLFILGLILFLHSCSSKKDEAILLYTQSFQLSNIDSIESALEKIDSAIKLDSTNLDFILFRSRLLSKSQNYNESNEILFSLEKKQFKIDTIYSEIAYNYFKKGVEIEIKDNYSKAIEYSTKSINKNSNYLNSHLIRIWSFHNQDEHDDALTSINSALTIFHNNHKLLLWKGIEKQCLGDNSAAFSDIKHSIDKGNLDSSDLSSAFRWLGLIKNDEKNFQAAIEFYTEAIKYKSDNYFIFLERGNCLREMGQREKACADYRTAADLGYVKIYDEIKSYCK